MKSKFIIRTCLPLQILALVFLLPVAAGAQAKSFGGKYQGTIKSPNGDVQVTLELKDDNGKISGHATTPHGVYEVVKTTLADGLLTLELSAPGSTGIIAMVAVLQDGKLNGDYDFAGQMQGKWVAVKKQ